MRDIASFRLPETRFFPRGEAEGKIWSGGVGNLLCPEITILYLFYYADTNISLPISMKMISWSVVYLSNTKALKRACCMCRLLLKHDSACAPCQRYRFAVCCLLRNAHTVSSASQTRQPMGAYDLPDFSYCYQHCHCECDVTHCWCEHLCEQRDLAYYFLIE